MKTIVTGGAGFIGSNLVKKLAAQGREIDIADDFSRGSKLNLQDIGISTNWPEIDLRDYNQTLKAIRGADTVFHLAARVGSVDYLHGNNLNELKALQANLTIDSNVFRACLESGVSRVVYASSVAVYPMNTQFSQDAVFHEREFEVKDNSAAMNPDGGYGWSKLMGELQLNWMISVKVGIARLFNIYGENQDLSAALHVVPALMRKAILYPQEEFKVWGDGTQSRDFLHVSDCTDALLRLEEKASSPPIVCNIGSGKVTSISKVAETIALISGKDIRINYDPRSKSVGPISRTADISLARSLLGWQPHMSIYEGLAGMYAWEKRRLSG